MNVFTGKLVRTKSDGVVYEVISHRATVRLWAMHEQEQGFITDCDEKQFQDYFEVIDDSFDLKSLRNLLAILAKRADVWSERQTLASLIQGIKNELDEVLNANTESNLEEELADSLALTLLLIIKNSKLSIGQVAQLFVDKLKKRSPHIFTGESVTAEEHLKRWKEAKGI